jgi:hypothetical protein
MFSVNRPLGGIKPCIIHPSKKSPDTIGPDVAYAKYVHSLHKNQNIMDAHEYDLPCATHTYRPYSCPTNRLQCIKDCYICLHPRFNRCHPSFKLAWTSLYLAWLCAYANLSISSHGPACPDIDIPTTSQETRVCSLKRALGLSHRGLDFWNEEHYQSRRRRLS